MRTAAGPIGGLYFLYFATVGVVLPFLPAYFKSLGLSATQVEVLVAVGPAFALLSPPLWGHLADRTGRPDRVMTIIGLGAALGFTPLLWVDGFAALFAALCGYAFFASAATTVMDSLALHHSASSGQSYARLRMFGSLGFVVSSVAFGLSVDEIDRRAVWATLALIGAWALWSLKLPAPPRSERAAPPSPLAGARLLRDSNLALLLAGSCLHWIACAPYHGLLSVHVRALELPPRVVGLSAGLGVIAEIAVFWLHPRLSQRIAPRHLLAVSFAMSSLRWLFMGLADSGWAIVSLSSLHGFTFGAFFASAVTYVARRVPSQLRATGQALFVSVSFGLGGLVGYPVAGMLYDAFGGHRVFLLASALELVAALIALTLERAEERAR